MSGSQALIEDAITQALAELDAECKLFGVRLLLIGGFAVRAYGKRKRETTDVDFVAPKGDQGSLIGLLQRLGYQVDPESRFGMKATRTVGERAIKVDISIEQIHDQETGSIYRFSAESFAQAERRVIESLSGEFRVESYVVPLADLLISKLMTARDQDASDAINLILGHLPSAQLEAEIVRKARQAGLATRLNKRIAELIHWSDRKIQDVMAGYIAGRLTVPELKQLRTSLRSLRI
jgi:hypothetical protein